MAELDECFKNNSGGGDVSSRLEVFVGSSHNTVCKFCITVIVLLSDVLLRHRCKI